MHEGQEQTTIIVVPCYNEVKRLPARDFLDFVGSCEHISFIFVNDGSTDDTGSIVVKLCNASPRRISMIHLKQNSGKAEAVRTGLIKALQSRPVYVGYWDADLSTPLWEIDRLASFMDKDPKIKAVFGARVQLIGRTIKRKAYRHYIGRFFATIFSQILRFPVYDTQCGAKVFRFDESLVDILSKPFLTRWLFDVELLSRMVCQSKVRASHDAMIREEPLFQWIHVGGSKIRIGNALHVLVETFRIWKNYR